MNLIQTDFVVFFAFYAFLGFILGIKNRRVPFGECRILNPLGAFVWIDAVVFGLFFTLVAIFCLFFEQFVLFCLIFTIFWAIRSIGEQVYWFLEQFAVTHRNKPQTLMPYRFFKGEETWIVMQIFWQCVSVVAIIASIYFATLFIRSL